MTPPRSPKKIFLSSAKPEDFDDIQIQDWVEGIGFVSTHYEEKFLRNYGKMLLRSHTSSTELTHCDHECVCQDYINLIRTSQANVSCNFEEMFHKCPHDTRSRPHARSTEAQETLYTAGMVKARMDHVRNATLDEALIATDDCWRRMHHGTNCHHHTMKRDLFLRFRKSIESIRKQEEP